MAHPSSPSRIALQLAAFGGRADGSVGTVNQAIAAAALESSPPLLTFAEPETGELLASLAPERAVYRITDTAKRKRYLNEREVSAFAEWMSLHKTDATPPIVIIGSPSAEARPDPNFIARIGTQLSYAVPSLQPILVSLGLTEAPQYKGLGWAAAQMSQLMRITGVQQVEVIGQAAHLRDYALQLLKHEYRRAGIETHEHRAVGDLELWDPESSQRWTTSQEAWNRRLPLARLLVRADQLTRLALHPQNPLPQALPAPGLEL